MKKPFDKIIRMDNTTSSSEITDVKYILIRSWFSHLVTISVSDIYGTRFVRVFELNTNKQFVGERRNNNWDCRLSDGQ